MFRGDTGDSSDYPHQVDSGKTVPGIRQRLGRTRSLHYDDATVEMTNGGYGVPDNIGEKDIHSVN